MPDAYGVGLNLFIYMQIEIVNNSDNPLPKYATIGSAGMDLYANESVTLQPFKPTIVKTGISIAVPQGYEAQVRCRSSVARLGLIVANGIGTIDSDYRGEIGVILTNINETPFPIAKGDRIAQLVIAKYERAEWQEVETLSETERGDGGFGSTGK